MSGQDLECQRLQRVAGQDGGGLVEGPVAGRPAAPQVVVVHGRQIVVDQRVGVDDLDRGRHVVEFRFLEAKRVARRIHQQRAHALAAVEGGIAHGLPQLGRRIMVDVQHAQQNGLEALLPELDPCGGVSRLQRRARLCFHLPG